MSGVVRCVFLGILALAWTTFAHAADGNGGLDGPLGDDESLSESNDDELDLGQMYDLCVSGCEGSRQMAYWDCYNAYDLCRQMLENCWAREKKDPTYHCLKSQPSMMCEQQRYDCLVAAENVYNACEASCESQYPQ